MDEGAEARANFHCVDKSLVDRQIISSLAVMLGNIPLMIDKIKINTLKEFLVFHWTSVFLMYFDFEP